MKNRIMTPFSKRIYSATKRMAEDMLIRNMAHTTIDAYTYHVDRFAKHFGQCPEDLGPDHIRTFQLWMIQEKKCSWSSFNQAVCGLRFLYTHTLPRVWVVQMIPFGNRPKKLPVVLGQSEVHRLIECVTHPKHRAVLLTLYAAGLRLSEATHLKLTDIDSERMQLRILQAKGHKDRYVPLSPRLLSELRAYWRHDRPKNYLFPGKTDAVPLSGATIQKVCKLAAASANIKKLVTPHTLRHSFATGLLEAGVDLMAISKLLGHASFTTTMIYLHCRKQHLESIPSPIDWLPVRQCPKWIDPSLQLPTKSETPPELSTTPAHSNA
jgi:integrase/recombinase XerD